MNKALRMKFATASTIGGFFITCLSGLIIFFEIEQNGIRPLHEWGSIAFVIFALWHILTHKRSFKAYFVNRQLLAVVSIVALAGLVLFVSSLNDVYIASVVEKRVISHGADRFSEALSIDKKIVLQSLAKRGVPQQRRTEGIDVLAMEYDFEVHEFLEEVLSGNNQ